MSNAPDRIDAFMIGKALEQARLRGPYAAIPEMWWKQWLELWQTVCGGSGQNPELAGGFQWWKCCLRGVHECHGVVDHQLIDKLGNVVLCLLEPGHTRMHYGRTWPDGYPMPHQIRVPGTSVLYADWFKHVSANDLPYSWVGVIPNAAQG